VGGCRAGAAAAALNQIQWNSDVRREGGTKSLRFLLSLSFSFSLLSLLLVGSRFFGFSLPPQIPSRDNKNQANGFFWLWWTVVVVVPRLLLCRRRRVPAA